MMMKRTVYILAVSFLMAFAISLFARQKSNGKTSKQDHILYPTVYLGNSTYMGGPIKKEEFDKLLKQGITSHDSMGYKYKVMGFDFNYAERQLYEDSAGNLKIMTDFSFEYCPGDTITHNIASSIYQRTKPGDTIFIDRVMVARYTSKTNKNQVDTNVIAARAMKCIITK